MTTKSEKQMQEEIDKDLNKKILRELPEVLALVEALEIANEELSKEGLGLNYISKALAQYQEAIKK